MSHGIWKELATPFDTALERLPAALGEQGFGVISQVDLGATLRTKLGTEIGRYLIFGACNPAFAHDAVTRDPRIGVLLPCNVVLYERPDGKAVLGAIDPMQSVGADPAFADIASDIATRLSNVLAAIP